MPGLGFQAIVPRRPPGPPRAQVTAGAARFLRDGMAFTVSELQEYPPARPWKNRPPRSGPRKDGRRTGSYGRGWPLGARVMTDRFIVINTVQYAVWVGGSRRTRPGQARAMRARGWKSIDDVKKELRRRFTPNLFLRYIGRAGR